MLYKEGDSSCGGSTDLKFDEKYFLHRVIVAVMAEVPMILTLMMDLVDQAMAFLPIEYLYMERITNQMSQIRLLALLLGKEKIHIIK